MNTKDILLVGAGVVVGYLLGGFINKLKNNAQDTIESEEPKIDQAKIDACNKEVADFMAMSRFTAGTDLEKVRKDAFDSCMKKAL